MGIFRARGSGRWVSLAFWGLLVLALLFVPGRREAEGDRKPENVRGRPLIKGFAVAIQARKRDAKKIAPSAVNIARIRRPSPSRGGRLGPSRDSKDGYSMAVVSTAYTFTGHRTAMGITPYRGVVAVDPRVIPLGSSLYIEGYGYARALDTGGAIKGKKIDVFFPTRREALKWGRRKVRIKVLR